MMMHAWRNPSFDVLARQLACQLDELVCCIEHKPKQHCQRESRRQKQEGTRKEPLSRSKDTTRSWFRSSLERTVTVVFSGSCVLLITIPGGQRGCIIRCSLVQHIPAIYYATRRFHIWHSVVPSSNFAQCSGFCCGHNVEGTIKYKIRSFHIGDVTRTVLPVELPNFCPSNSKNESRRWILRGRVLRTKIHQMSIPTWMSERRRFAAAVQDWNTEPRNEAALRRPRSETPLRVPD